VGRRSLRELVPPYGDKERNRNSVSTIRQNGLKIVLPRGGPDEFWQLVHEHYAGGDQRLWKYLAMLALRENAGWPLEQIGLVFGHNKGHVTRCLAAVKRELRERFRMSPEVLQFGDELTEDESGLDGEAEGERG
jgi:hypothetical protein